MNSIGKVMNKAGGIALMTLVLASESASARAPEVENGAERGVKCSSLETARVCSVRSILPSPTTNGFWSIIQGEICLDVVNGIFFTIEPIMQANYSGFFEVHGSGGVEVNATGRRSLVFDEVFVVGNNLMDSRDVPRYARGQVFISSHHANGGELPELWFDEMSHELAGQNLSESDLPEKSWLQVRLSCR